LIATAESELPLPLRPKGYINFFRVGRSMPVRTIAADVGTETSDDVVILKPHQPTTLIFSGFITPDLVALAKKRDLGARFKVIYLDSDKSVAHEYVSSDFTVDSSSVSFDR
jgi:hypothetical protein